MRTDPLGATSCMSRTQCRFVIEMTLRGGLSYLRIPVMAPPRPRASTGHWLAQECATSNSE